MKVKRLKNLSSWRKTAVHTWGEAGDPSIYGSTEIDVSIVQPMIERLRAETGQKITITHVLAKAMGYALERVPEANGYVIGKKIMIRDQINVFVMVDIDNGGDLSGVVVEEVNKKTVAQIAQETAERARSVKSHEDEELKKTKRIMEVVPNFLMGPLLGFMRWWIFKMGGSPALFGMKKKDPFGGVWITNIASFNLKFGWAPLVRFSCVPIVLVVGKIEDKVRVITNDKGEKEMVIRPMLPIGATIDHRLVDGAQIGRIGRYLMQTFEEPETVLMNGAAPTPEASHTATIAAAAQHAGR